MSDDVIERALRAFWGPDRELTEEDFGSMEAAACVLLEAKETWCRERAQISDNPDWEHYWKRAAENNRSYARSIGIDLTKDQ